MDENGLQWWQRGIIYQIYPRSFQDASGDGTGDLAGIIQRLDYLAETLRVDALWLSPFYPSPMADFGYDVSNYLDIHPIFGDLTTFDELVQQAHHRDLKVIIDFVPNHTSSEHPWFLESCSSRQNPKRDWYVWAEAKADSSPPNNWLSIFGGSAWEWDEPTGQYYLHTFLKEQPDLNWRNPEVRAAMLDVLRFWLARGVDGFRVDAAHFIMKDPNLRDNPPNPGPPPTGMPFREYTTQLHLFDQAHADIHDVFREMRSVIDSYGDEHPRLAIAEIDEREWRAWAGYYGAQFDELHMPFNFALLFCPWTAASVREVVDSVEAVLPAGGWPNYVLGNHDIHRIATRVGPEQARIAMMLLLTLRGTPTIYYGDEIGMQDGAVPPEMVRDPFERNVPGLGLGRDPERTPMQWSSAPNAGFCPPDVEPWLPLADDYHKVNVALQSEDPCSMLSLTRALIQLRRTNPALTNGSYQPVDGRSADCFVYLRALGAARWLIALSFSHADQTVTAPDLGRGFIVLSTHLDRREPAELGSLRLRPNEGCIVALVESE